MIDKSKPILIVDDSRTVCGIISKIANQIGFSDVGSVHSGLAALAQLKKRKYRLIIIDWEMSPMSGPDLVIKIRDDKSLSDTAIVLMTAYRQRAEEMIKSGKTFGADIHILKPFTAEALAKKLADKFPETEAVLI